MTEQMTYVDGVPLTRYWLISAAKRPKVYTQHPTMTAEEIRHGTQETWDRFYTLRAIWQRASWLKTLGERLGFVLISKLYRQMYAAPVSRPTARG